VTADRLWTLAELAEYLQVPEQTVYTWRKRGAGPRGFRIGRHVRFRREDVEAWIDTLGDEEEPELPSGSLGRLRQLGGGGRQWAG
jgi:excisionase family DNA binding protein